MGRIRGLDGSGGHAGVLAIRVVGAGLLALGLVIPWGPVAEAEPPADPPSAQEAQTARDAVAAGTLDVRQAQSALDTLRSQLDAAQVRVQVAAADYAEAQESVGRAERRVAAARSAAEKASKGESVARAGLAEVYRASARDADMGSLGVALEADSIPDLVGRSSAERAVQRKLGGALAAYQDARASSESADARWTAAKAELDAAAEQAEAAFDTAQAAAADLTARTQAAEVERTALVERLAHLRQTSVAIEREREAARAAAAAAAREAAAQAELDRQRARDEAAAEAQAQAQGAGGYVARGASGGPAPRRCPYLHLSPSDRRPRVCPSGRTAGGWVRWPGPAPGSARPICSARQARRRTTARV
ncbi:hypothetical protein AB1046_14395 [Promicromonospora sp. Populi]|uniref:hypothetical protein n=1 Tax=Promicromonospora sp. Populi TaxID=3239420 RepID=UPI0034E2E98E